MYLKKILITLLKIKNVIFLIAGVFLIAASASIVTDLAVHYWGDWNTVINARSTPDSIRFSVIGIILIVLSRISRKLIKDANFYSGYFEGDLNGYIDFQDIAMATGKSPSRIKMKLMILRPLYMKKFRIVRTAKSHAHQVIELYSKTVTCSCRSCGGLMEKRIYFTGVCPYCKGSDLNAKVISGQNFYFIQGSSNRKPNDTSYYEGKALNAKLVGFIFGFSIALFLSVILLLFMADTISKYNNEAYIKELILSGKAHYYSFELIRADMINSIIFSAFAAAAIIPAIPITLARIARIIKAKRYAKFFSKFPYPYVDASVLWSSGSKDPVHELKGLVNAIREGYLRGCSPEIFNGQLRIGLAKQIVKDHCPCCGAPIVGAVDANYRCRYCQNLIMGVIQKRSQ